MTEHREIDSDDAAPSPLGPARASRAVDGFLRSIPSRKLSTRAKIGLALVASLCLWGIVQGAFFARNWLARNEAFAISLGEIELSPPPPDFLLGGGPALLARLQKSSGKEGPIYLLDQDLGEIGDLFRVHCPWVERVTRVELRKANRLVVSLEFREPVARLEMSAGEQVALDARTHVLPIEDLSPAFASQLPPIRGISVTGERPGLLLETAKSTRQPDRVDPETLAGIHLATFLKEKSTKTPLPDYVIFLHKGSRRIFLRLRTADGLWMLWGEPPGEESKGLPSAAQKLTRLREWYPKYAIARTLPNQYLDLNDAVDELHEGHFGKDRQDPVPFR